MSVFHKINILERVNQMFVCSICCDPKVGGNTKPFATSNASLFLEHQRCCHSSMGEFECIYCCSHVPNAHFMQHIHNHFATPIDYKFTCPYCSERVKNNIFNSIDHLEMRHPDCGFECLHCRTQFLCRSDLVIHLKKHFLFVFHCSFDNCFVKSHNMAAVLSHLKRLHNGSRCLRVECVVTCIERCSTRTQCNCDIMASTCDQSPRTPPLNIASSPTGTDDCQLINLPYSTRVLSKLSLGFDERLRDDLTSKMAQYAKFKVRLEIVDGQKQFVCSTCQYRSVHSLADVRKHILGCHCSVSTSYTRLCLRASRLDTNTFSLFSDRKLISFANEKLKRAESSTGWDGSGDNSALQLLDDSEPEQDSPIDTVMNRPLKRSLVTSGAGMASMKRAKLTQRQNHSAKMRPDSPVPEVGQPLVRNEKIDRVIHLNFSWHVLERLVAGQCPDRYLPVLRQKMEVYALHSILLTRRNGKRYFLCSHCPNCSPHGMNDIRKHILGVHARLPERFKAAAMYCSRMNRDNYGLLSDDELLKKNQDMVRWRKAPPAQSGDDDDHTLAPLHPPATGSFDDDDANSPPVHNMPQSALHSSNIFLSGGPDNDCTSPLSADAYNSFVNTAAAANHSVEGHGLAAFPFNLFVTTSNGLHSNGNDLLGGISSSHFHRSNMDTSNASNDSSSPKLDDNSSVTTSSSHMLVTNNGRSRRSLVLKSRNGGATVANINHNNNSNRDISTFSGSSGPMAR